MPREIQDGETIEIQGSAAKPYKVTRRGPVIDCTCPAWKVQSLPIDKRSCKHVKGIRGVEAEAIRTGLAVPLAVGESKKTKAKEKDKGAPPVLLAHAWDGVQDLTGWWLSIKWDGIRAWWTGTQLLSRLGNPIYAPPWFLEGLPKNIVLDGELWLGNGKFQDCVSIVRRQDYNEDWKKITFRVFDAPELLVTEEDLTWSPMGFEDRQMILEATTLPKHVKVVKQTRCQGNTHLEQLLDSVIVDGGEGLMAREPNSPYEHGRSSTLLKVKRYHDAEGTVIGYQEGKGRHKGRLGALIVRADNGREFQCGTGFSDEERKNRPPIGARITYRFFELTKDNQVPRFPSFVSLRDYE